VEIRTVLGSTPQPVYARYVQHLTALSRRIPWRFVAAFGSAATATFALLAVHAYQPTRNWGTCLHPLHPVVRPGKFYFLCHIRDERVLTVHPHQVAALVYVGLAIAIALVTAGALVVLASRMRVSQTPGALN
jgi:hypothetical protein